MGVSLGSSQGYSVKYELYLVSSVSMVLVNVWCVYGVYSMYVI